MHTEDAVELARNIRSVHYGEWTVVSDDLLYVTCGECGESHALMFRRIGDRLYKVRIDMDRNLTDATREADSLDLPLYREVIRLREENAQLKLRNAELEPSTHIEIVT